MFTYLRVCRYCVLLSTEWLYFNSQEDALAEAQPLGVLKVLGAKPMAADATTYIDFGSVSCYNR